MWEMLLNDWEIDIDRYWIMYFELVSVYDDYPEINYSNLVPKMARLNILEGTQLHLIDQEGELNNEKKMRKKCFIWFNVQLSFFWMKRNLHAVR